MPDTKEIGPFTPTPARIMIVVLGILAIVMIVGAILGGVGNYQTLRESTISSSEPPASSSSAP